MCGPVWQEMLNGQCGIQFEQLLHEEYIYAFGEGEVWKIPLWRKSYQRDQRLRHMDRTGELSLSGPTFAHYENMATEFEEIGCHGS